MKRFYLNILFAAAFLASSLALSAQNIIYVRATASGANDGTTWANAYTNLNTALNAAQAGSQVWVAAGTYKPTDIGADSTFYVKSGVSLYGGFAGTETSLAQRNLAANSAVLNGDIQGDDVDDNFTANRSDNVTHVVTVADSATQVVVDGFTIRNGSTTTVTTASLRFRSGGGLFLRGQATLRNLYFTQNTGLLGGGLAIQEFISNGSVVEDCIFDKNYSGTAGAALTTIRADSVVIRNCIIRENSTNRGSYYASDCLGFLVDGCLFEGNSNSVAGVFSVGIAFFDCSYVVNNTVFDGNLSTNAAAAYVDNRNGGDVFEFVNCEFIDNESTGFCGAMEAVGTTFTMRNCTFQGNLATSTNGGLLLLDCIDYYIVSCDFIENESGDIATTNTSGSGGGLYFSDCTGRVDSCFISGNRAGYGAGMISYGIGTNIVENSIFETNEAGTSGGGLSAGFLSRLEISRCNISGNKARFGGGIFCQNDSTELAVNETIIEGNSASLQAGGVLLFGEVPADFHASRVEFNTTTGPGGGFYITDDSLQLDAVVTIRKSFILSNDAGGQSGGIYLSNSNVEVINSVIAANIGNDSALPGAAISNNASDGKTSTLTILNSTIADNTHASGGTITGGGIAQFEDADSSNCVMNIQNTILANPDNNYVVENATPVVNSTGGNLSTDNSLATALTATNDANNIADPQFTNPILQDYSLQSSSPAVNTGVATGAPSEDIFGGNRDGQPDKGAFEFGSVGTFNPAEALALTVMPNPVVSFTEAVLENAFTGEVNLDMVAANGALVSSQRLVKSTDSMRIRVEMSDLPAGLYYIAVRCGEKVYLGSVSKN